MFAFIVENGCSVPVVHCFSCRCYGLFECVAYIFGTVEFYYIHVLFLSLGAPPVWAGAVVSVAEFFNLCFICGVIAGFMELADASEREAVLAFTFATD